MSSYPKKHVHITRFPVLLCAFTGRKILPPALDKHVVWSDQIPNSWAEIHRKQMSSVPHRLDLYRNLNEEVASISQQW